MSTYVERLQGLLSHLDEISRRANRARPGDTRTERQIVADLVRQNVDPAELRENLRALLADNVRLRVLNDELFDENHELRYGSTASAKD